MIIFVFLTKLKVRKGKRRERRRRGRPERRTMVRRTARSEGPRRFSSITTRRRRT